MSAATGPKDNSGVFMVRSDYTKGMRIGVNCKRSDGFFPMFVSTPVAIGTVSLQPIISVLVWFSTTQETKTIFLQKISDSHEVNGLKMIV